jgi:hypothetical protein
MHTVYTFLFTDYREPLFYKSIISIFYIRHAVNLRGCDIYAAPFPLNSVVVNSDNQSNRDGTVA